MLLLSVIDVRDRHHEAALAQLDSRPELHEAFDRELLQQDPGLQRLFFHEAHGWRFLDVCELCEAECGWTVEPQLLAGLCETCDEAQGRAAVSLREDSHSAA